MVEVGGAGMAVTSEGATAPDARIGRESAVPVPCASIEVAQSLAGVRLPAAMAMTEPQAGTDNRQ